MRPDVCHGPTGNTERRSLLPVSSKHSKCRMEGFAVYREWVGDLCCPDPLSRNRRVEGFRCLQGIQSGDLCCSNLPEGIQVPELHVPHFTVLVPKGYRYRSFTSLTSLFRLRGYRCRSFTSPTSPRRDTGTSAWLPGLICSGPGWDTRRADYPIAGLDIRRPAVGPHLRKAWNTHGVGSRGDIYNVTHVKVMNEPGEGVSMFMYMSTRCPQAGGSFP